MNTVADEILLHYGTPRRSGRYPWGSGKDPYQHSLDFYGRIEELKKQGWTETPENIMKEFGISTTEYRKEKAIGRSNRRALDVERARSLKEDGISTTEIGRKMGLNESSVRSLLNEKSEARMKEAEKTANFLKEQVNEKRMIEVGRGVERDLNISYERMRQAIKILEAEGYHYYPARVEQATNPGKHTTYTVLAAPDIPYKDVYKTGDIQSIKEYASRDGGETFSKFQYPSSMDSKRLQIRYAEDGGIEMDGTIQIRRGVQDLSLGNSRYSQVRILVDNDRYLKGMAIYSDDSEFPPGVDVIFNTNKTKDVPMRDVLKKIKANPENPFGALIKANGQSTFIDKDGNEKLSLINKTKEEGDWSDWKDTLPSQFLSKQPLELAKRQLGLAIKNKQDEYNEILELDNPTVKKHFLNQFAEDCDKAAVNLQAAALPGQKYHVIIPAPAMKDTEVYAPKYENGTKLALIRYPHGGLFEIPILTVNNKAPVAKRMFPTDIEDAVIINNKVAEQLSGADFDGDTVMCIPSNIPNSRLKIKNKPPLKDLEGFDPKLEYKGEVVVDENGVEHCYRNGKEFKRMRNTGNEMGRISNLITDMTLRGATDDELARAVKHSMVVIDAEKHYLDYKQSELDNNIAALKKEYQYTLNEKGTYSKGASTLISRAKGDATVIKRQGSPHINRKGAPDYDPTRPEGSLIYKEADDAHYINYKTGKPGTRHQQSTRMAETDDARTLISDANTPMENEYANFANKMKAMANEARMEMVSTGKIAYSPEAKAKYQKEVDSLNSKLNRAMLNKPRERMAQLRTAAETKAIEEEMKASGEKVKKKDLRKISTQALNKYRNLYGAERQNIIITDREWEAIQKGAISENKLRDILNNTDPDVLRKYATPRKQITISTAAKSRVMSMRNRNHSIAEIAAQLGMSTSTVSKILKGEL